MDKIYLVQEVIYVEDYSGYDIFKETIATFSTREKAEEYLNKHAEYVEIKNILDESSVLLDLEIVELAIDNFDVIHDRHTKDYYYSSNYKECEGNDPFERFCNRNKYLLYYTEVKFYKNSEDYKEERAERVLGRPRQEKKQDKEKQDKEKHVEPRPPLGINLFDIDIAGTAVKQIKDIINRR